MKCFVTGASGFLGTHLCRTLRAAGHTVTAPTSKECDLTSAPTLSQWNDVRFDSIFHLAAWTQAGDFCLHHPGEQWLVNQQINTNVLHWWHTHHPEAKLIAIGTSCCYEPGKPHAEENFMRGEPIESLYTYGMTKRMLYQGLRALNLQFGHRYLFLIPSTLYGAGYHLDGRQMHFIFDLVRKILEGKYKGKPVQLWGDGTQKRELIHVNDFVGATLSLTETTHNEIVNIGGGVEYSIAHYAHAISQIAEYDAALIQYDTTKYVGARSKVLEIGKLRRLLPTFRHTDLDAGLREVVTWYRKEGLRL